MSFASETPIISRITSLLDELNGEKQAAAKRADETVMEHTGSGSKDDPGSRGGPSSHPSAKVDSNTQSYPTGSRFAENHADMKVPEAVGNVDRVSPNSGGSQDDKQLNIGTHQSLTGEDPKVEDNYKGTKDDPGTSSKMNAERARAPKYGAMRPARAH